MSILQKTKRTFISGLTKAISSKPDVSELKRLGNLYVNTAVITDLSKNMFQHLNEKANSGEITSDDLRKISWIHAQMMSKSQTTDVELYDQIIINGNDDPFEEFIYCALFSITFSQKHIKSLANNSTVVASHSEQQIKNAHMNIAKKRVKKWDQDTFNKIMDKLSDYGFGDVVNAMTDNENDAYWVPAAFKTKHRRWVNHNKTPAVDAHNEIIPTLAISNDQYAYRLLISTITAIKILQSLPQDEWDQRIKIMGEKHDFDLKKEIISNTSTKITFFMDPTKFKTLENDQQHIYAIVKAFFSETSKTANIYTFTHDHSLLEGYTIEEALKIRKTTNATIWKNDKISELQNHFKIIHQYGFFQYFDQHFNDKHDFIGSKYMRDKFNTWKNLTKTKEWMQENPPKYSKYDFIQNEPLPDEPAVDVIETVEIEEPQPSISPIKVVMVPDLLPEGEGAESVPDLVEVFNERSGEKQAREIIIEPRDEWILDALINDPNVDHNACRQFENPLKTMDHTGRYYSVFHVVLLNGNTTQIAVSTCKGQITYLMKDEHGLMVDPTTERCKKEISDLRHEPMVQTKRCHTKEGFQRDIMEIVFRAAEDIKPQTKSTTRWQGVMSRASQIEDSLIAFYVTNNRTPNRNDGLIIHGELGQNDIGINKSLVELDTRWDLVCDALKNSSVMGLEDYKSLHEYACSMIDETQPQKDKDKKYAPAPL